LKFCKNTAAWPSRAQGFYPLIISMQLGYGSLLFSLNFDYF